MSLGLEHFLQQLWVDEGTMGVRDITIEQGKITVTLKVQGMSSGNTGESEVHFELRRWGGKNPMKLLNEMVCLLNLEGSCVLFPFTLVLVDDDILSDILSYVYLHCHTVLVNLLLSLKFSFVLTIFQIPPLCQKYPYLIVDNFFYNLITTFSSPPF